MAKRRELDLGAVLSPSPIAAGSPLVGVPIGRFVPMGDIAVALRSDVVGVAVVGPEKPEKRGAWLKLLRGEVDTEPEDMGE